MEINELYLKTAFCCMACDGEIAPEEVGLIKKYSANNNLFEDLSVEEIVNGYIEEINENGIFFLNEFLREIEKTELSEEQEMNIIKIAIEMIEADNVIQYSEIKFFKKIRRLLAISDEVILAEFPDKEDYLLPDINTNDYEFIQNESFNFVKLKDINWDEIKKTNES